MNSHLLLLLVAELFSIVVGLLAFRKNSISTSGLIALLSISSLFILLDELAFLWILFLMFATSSLLSKIQNASKKAIENRVHKNGPRDWIQAICNLGPASLLGIIYYFFPDDLILAGFTGSVAAANGDSWASELGTLSKTEPVLITNFKKVPKGISGGITTAGTLGGLTGVSFITLISFIFFHLFQIFPENQYMLLLSILSGGIAGFLFDSLLGGLWQVLFSSPEGFLSENPYRGKRIKGFHWINNDMVNLLTTLFSALISMVLFYYLNR